MAKNAQGLGEWMSSKQYDRLQKDERPHNPEGTLYKPGEKGRTHGEKATSAS